jgi:D-glycero-alpha-D-manno-heptose-7-phosphate kinase
VSIHYDGDIPARSGMGSSSAFTVGLLHGMYALEGKMVTKHRLAKETIHIEQNLIKECVGSQDQVFAAYGGLNLINFLTNGEIVIEPIIMKPEKLNNFEKKFMLFFTGISRIASEVACDKIKNLTKNENNLLQMKSIVEEACEILVSPDRNLNEFGELMNETWKLKKTLSDKVTNSEIDELYEIALKNGAVGGKLLGAGGGGFIVFYVETENQPKVRQALNNYLHVPFKFDFDGSKIIVYQPD